jgi:hypothetical protein
MKIQTNCPKIQVDPGPFVLGGGDDHPCRVLDRLMSDWQRTRCMRCSAMQWKMVASRCRRTNCLIAAGQLERQAGRRQGRR